MRNFFVKSAVVAFILLLCVPVQGRKPASIAGQQPQNIILMVGDGMGLAQVSALMISEGYGPVNLERAAAGGFVKTYSASSGVTDSAAAGTAYSTGEKTTNGYLGVAPDSTRLETILEKAEKAGMATGLVVTTLIQHATPGAFYAHNTNRDDYPGIALDLIPSGVDVAIGGGRNYMTGREDGRDLLSELRQKGYIVADDIAGLDAVHSGSAVALYDGDFPYVLAESNGRDPEYLAKATGKALEILTANGSTKKGGPAGKRASDKGFFLMVEGSHIDHGGHDNNVKALIGEMRDFDDAVGVAFDYADAHPGTLVVVVADHETGGLTLPSGKEHALLPKSGVEPEWSTGGHSATMTPMFIYGSGAKDFGVVMENTAVNHRIESLLGLE